MNPDDLTLQAGLGEPPVFPPDIPYINVSRVNSLSKCEYAYYADYVLNKQYAATRTGSPKMWLGTWIHAFVERLSTHGWDSHANDLTLLLAEASADLDPTDLNYDAYMAESDKLDRICTAYVQRWRNRQTYDRILEAEVEGWVLCNGVCFLWRADKIVVKDGKVYYEDTKTSSKHFDEILGEQRVSLQAAVTGEALARLSGARWGLPFGGFIVDYVSTDIPGPTKTPRTNKDGSQHAGDLKANERRLAAFDEWLQFGFQKLAVHDFADAKYRADIAWSAGAFHKARLSLSLADGTVSPQRQIHTNSFGCRGCAHKEWCLHLSTPEADYTREPDYVDRANQRRDR